MTLPAVPPWMAPTVSTAGWAGERSRVISVCRALPIWKLTATGSTERCGRAAWPPLPVMVSTKPSVAAVIGPGWAAIWPDGEGVGQVEADGGVDRWVRRRAPSWIISAAPPVVSSAGWKAKTTFPGRRLALRARTRAAPRAIAVWPSWPQACILPGD